MQNLYKSIDKLRQYLDKNVIAEDHPVYMDLKTKIIQQLSNTSEKFANTQDPKLYKIYDTLIGSYAKLRLHRTQIKEFHPHVYRFFNVVHSIKSPEKHFKFYPTKLYEEFIKGITVFHNTQIEGKPTYHRDPSCGHKDVAYLVKFQYLPSDTPQRRKEKLEALQLCIVERKIYNKIYEQILHQQDIGHLGEIMNLDRLYFDYTSTEIQVDVSFENDVLPYLAILTIVKNKQMITRISYEKRPNGDVIVEKYKHHVETERKQLPTQRFDVPTPLPISKS